MHSPSTASSGATTSAAQTDAAALERELIVVGAPDAADHVQRALNGTPAILFAAADLAAAKARAGSRTVGIVLALPDAHAAEAVARLRDATRDATLPVFAVVDEDFPVASTRALYEAGAAAVLQWPHEVLLLPRVVEHVLSAPSPEEDDAPAGVDAAFERGIAMRLALANGVGRTVDVRVEDGVARACGSVASTWQKQRVATLLGHVPGIVEVDVDGLGVQAPRRSDEDLLAHVRDLVTVIPGVERETISVSVQEGRVDLAGTVASRAQLLRLVEVIANVPGVREVSNHIVVSPHGAQRSAILARTLQTTIAALHPEVAVDVVAFGSVVVLSGRVPSGRIRKEIEKLVTRHGEIEHVVDKTIVP